MLKNNIVSYIKDGIAKPEIQSLANKYMQQLTESTYKATGLDQCLNEKSYGQALKNAREQNLTRLAG